ncbi:hybrid sensor histidine kinase/response regulator [Herbaspirillum sp. SJZ099]|uniref:hybrid sensor histidine kinase/response regulator n=1 Tax=Herbaspirillum sp. SJZ099 TaxID=2572916 RepID=UPI0011A42F2A|nr:hybrid sensor histidine kinase/response regulator [Herbaspirillum sp. SJZ099]
MDPDFFFDRKIFAPLLQRSERVFESESLNRTIIATAPVGLCLLSLRDGAVLLQNGVLQSSDNGVSPLPQQFLALYRNVRNDKRGSDIPLDGYDLEITLADGNVGHLLVNLARSKYQGEEVLLCSFSDITARKELEQKLQEARAAADAANHAKSAFLATMSHEIRTPLNGILGNLELLGRTPLGERQQDRLRIIDSSSRDLLDIINDILDFSKVEAGQMVLETIRFDILDLIEQAIAIFVPLADAKDLRLFYAIPPTLVRCYEGDPTRIRQILINLLSNAIKFTEQGKIVIQVDAEEGAAGSLLRIRVSDTGIGISPARQRQLFQPFTQAEASTTRLFGGTGLGLALCKRLTDLMQGTIAVDSRQGAGSSFTVRLPLAAIPPAAARGGALPDTPDVSDSPVTEAVLLCPQPEWQASIVPHLAAWGIRTTLITHPKGFDMPHLPLILFGGPRVWSVADEDRIRARAARVIDVLEDGPRSPVSEAHRIIVSCYALDSLRMALSMAPVNGGAAKAQAAGMEGREDNAAATVRVLVVEDHRVNLSLIHDQLETLGYSISLADKAVDGLALFDQNSYDIVLTDLGMAGMDGYAFAKILRSRGARLPIIAITAHASRDEYLRCKDAGIDDILLKPMSLGEIEKTVRKHLLLQPAAGTGAAHAAGDRKEPLSEELHRILQDSSRQSLEGIRKALADGEAVVVLEQLHSIKGAFAMQRQAPIVAMCSALEHLAKAGDLPAVQAGLPELAALIQASLQRLGRH